MDSLLALVVFAILSGVAAWLKRRQGTGQPDPVPGPPSGAPAPEPSPARSWEEELRRLLEGEPLSLPPKPAPPPVIQPQRPPTAPLPTSSPRPRPVVITPLPASLSPPPPSKPAARIPVKVVAVTANETVEAPAAHLASMAESAAAYQRARQLHDGVARHLGQIDAQTEHHLVKTSPVRRRSRSPDVAQAIAWARNPRSARQAVVAALILGPPKALDRFAADRFAG
jgi:hypothetical protein